MICLRRFFPLSLLMAVVACATTPIQESPSAAMSVSAADASAMAAASASASSAARDHMMIPLTSSSAEAKHHFMLGLRSLDVGLAPAARSHFAAAVAADESFALAHLYSAFTANSLGAYRAHLERAGQLADRASTAEQLMIRIEQRDFANDQQGRLELAQQLVAAAPTNPRALQTLAAVQFALGRPADARATLERAIQLAPRFAPVHIQLGNSYLVFEPRDLARAEEHVRHAVDLEPNEAYTHDFMGDVFRAQNRLAEARAEYTRMGELDPSRALAFQQRAHVNAFLGNFAEARADYDRAIALGDPDEKASYGVYRALTAVHAGDPVAAERELDQLVTIIDGMNLPGATGAKIFALFTQLQIALHHRHFDVAERAVDRLRPLFRQQAEMGRTPEFRRAREADIAYIEGILAARKGDYATARSKAQEYMRLREADNNPRKNEAAHELLGMIELAQGNHQAAVAHFAQADPNDLYVTYHHALALEGAGRTAEARELFRRVAENNFNSPGLALTKRDAARRAG